MIVRPCLQFFNPRSMEIGHGGKVELSADQALTTH
jgi:hypothetical protein